MALPPLASKVCQLDITGIFIRSAFSGFELNMRGEVKPVARDNVLFELGMFIGKLGRKKAFVVHPGKNGVSLPSDLAGITTAPYDPNERNLAAALGPVSTRIRTAVRAERGDV